MSVKSGRDAYNELRYRLGQKPAAGSTWPEIPEKYPFVRAEPAGDFTVGQPGADDVWGPGGQVPPLRDPAAYDLGGRVGELNKPPAEGLADVGKRQAYCAASIDVTMRGGTTSGVVYPMAVCELARAYRLRNIGGASAGAIAAAAAAAAEAGRSGGAGASREPSEDDRKQGHVRAGFAGFADVMAWLAQVDDPDPDQFRVGQLFRPTQPALPLFRLVVAYMRRRYPVILLLFAGAFGKVSKWANIIIAVVSLLAAALWTGRSALLGAVGLLALTLLAAGILIAIAIVAMRKKGQPPAEMREPVLSVPEPATSLLIPIVLAATGVAGLVLAGLTFRVPLPKLAVVWLFTMVALAAVAITSVLRLVLGAEKHSFGLVSGSSPKVGKSVWNWVAGLPRATVDRPLVGWLSETISELAGLDKGTPLRFGHLWFGTQYEPGGESPDRCREAAAHPARRLVNLELVTTELVEGLSYKFPLPPSDEMEKRAYSALYVRKSDLQAAGSAIFPDAVVAALCATPARDPDEHPEIRIRDRRTGECLDDLYRLPEPWDLPVIFAVRLSLSLPALLQAVRVYRISKIPSTVRDEFGLPIGRGSENRIRYPAGAGTWWAEELWFSDGGITSNFPIHLFDSLFPLWPTVGITLSPYQPGFRHQDVWLPQDWQGHQVIGAPVSGGMGGFVSAIVNAARGWRDTAQSQMPSYVGRIATVRQSKTEGGMNLFMPKETVAALALRGELAGARLRRRFRSAWWRRNQWLRFRTAVGNIEELRQDMQVNIACEPYCGLVSPAGSGTLELIRDSLTEGDPDRPDDSDWWQPAAAGYWVSEAALSMAICAIPPAGELREGIPGPEPELRQVPPA